MKIEICDNTHNVLIVALIAIILGFIGYTAISGYTTRTTTAMERGYVERPTMGSQQILWQKP